MDNTFHNAHLYQKITEKIKAQLNSDTLRPGDRVPSVEEIKSTYGVSHITAMRVFKDLSTEGLIHLIRGKGYFVSDSKRSPVINKQCIAAMLRTSRMYTYFDNFLNDMNAGIHRECLCNGYDVLYPHAVISISDSKLFMDKNASEEIIGAAVNTEDRVDGFIFDGCVPDDVIEKILRKVSKPIVIVDRKSKLPVDSVYSDCTKGTRSALDMTIKMGYDNFIIPRSSNCIPNVKDRIAAFLDALKTLCIPSENIHIIEDAYLKDWNILYEEIISIRNSIPSQAKILIFAPTDANGRYICDKLNENKIIPGKDIGLLSYGGFGYAYYKEQELTTVKIDPDKMGRKAVNVLIDRVSGKNQKKPSEHIVEVTLSMGKTI